MAVGVAAVGVGVAAAQSDTFTTRPFPEAPGGGMTMPMVLAGFSIPVTGAPSVQFVAVL